MVMPSDMQGAFSVSIDQVYDLAGASREIIRNQGHLPSELIMETKSIGTGSLLHLFSSAYLDILEKTERETYEVIPFDCYPKEHEEDIIGEVMSYKNWIVHRTDLDMAHLAEITRMQLWTLKPAIER